MMLLSHLARPTRDVIPAKAGTHMATCAVDGWIPAFAGMTSVGMAAQPAPLGPFAPVALILSLSKDEGVPPHARRGIPA